MISQQRKGDWIQTYTGRQFWPLDPRAAEIFLEDIAAGLSNECRYGGHCLRFYSVAEHSVLMTLHALANGYSRREARAVLFHDASEGLGLKDIPRPVKIHFDGYKPIEHAVMVEVAKRFDFDWPMTPELKLLDERIGLTEENAIMAKPPAAWRDKLNFGATDPLPVTIKCWPPEESKAQFLWLARAGLGVAA